MATMKGLAYSWRCLLLSILIHVSASSPSFLSLDGSQWLVSNGYNNITSKATVPGGIYSDLVEGNILAEDPLFRYNDINYRWVAKENWTYQRMFTVTPDLLVKQAAFLVCHGLDTVATIYINDKPLGLSRNMFVRSKFNVKPFLVPGNNKITVSFESPISYARRKNDQQLRNNLYIIPPFCPTDVQKGECHVNYIRKAQCSFSWDWGPAIPSVGIWKSIGLEFYDYLIIRDVMAQTIYEPVSHQWALNTTVIVETSASAPTPGLPVSVSVSFQLENWPMFRTNVTFVPSSGGYSKLNFQFPVTFQTPIKLWWPNGVKTMTSTGLKEKGRTLYDLKVTVAPSGVPAEAFSKTVRIGFRTIQLIEADIQPKGATFYFLVNGVPIFMKGSNWIPADILPEKVDINYLRYLLLSAKYANMNMLRVWGGGIYESEEFYALADELGILLWQDFMFAVALYPTDPAFLNTVAQEVQQQVQRLQHHPSIALWAGNNENEAAITQHWWPEIFFKKRQYKIDYIKLYVDTIRPIVRIEDPGRSFLTSSPSNGKQAEKDGWFSPNPQDSHWGDVHFYDYASDAWDWKIYPSPKFASEYGIQSYSSLSSWKKVAVESDLTYPLSEFVIHRQHHSGGGLEMENLISRHFKLPSHGLADRFDDLIYLSQVSQAMGIKTETEFYRRNRALSASGEGMTMGALYWQLNDVWISPSWASIEYGGNWKMLHYYAKNFFEPILVSPFQEKDHLRVSLVNDVLDDLKVHVTLMFYNWSSFVPLLTDEVIVTSPKLSALPVYSKPTASLLQTAGCRDANHCVVRVRYQVYNSTLSGENVLLLGSPKNSFGIQKAHVVVSDVKVSGGGGFYVYSLYLQTNAISLFVWLDFAPEAQISGHFCDNGFFMFETRKIIHFMTVTQLPIPSLISSLRIKTVTDVVDY